VACHIDIISLPPTHVTHVFNGVIPVGCRNNYW